RARSAKGWKAGQMTTPRNASGPACKPPRGPTIKRAHKRPSGSNPPSGVALLDGRHSLSPTCSTPVTELYKFERVEAPPLIQMVTQSTNLVQFEHKTTKSWSAVAPVAVC